MSPGSLSEGAGSPQGLTEGVSSDGCSMPTIHTPAHINSEIFERLRASKYTPSVSHSLDSSLREGAGNGRVPFSRVLAEIPGCGRFSSPLRDSKVFTFHHSSKYSLKSRAAGDFHRPYGTLGIWGCTICMAPGYQSSSIISSTVFAASARDMCRVPPAAPLWPPPPKGTVTRVAS